MQVCTCVCVCVCGIYVRLCKYILRHNIMVELYTLTIEDKCTMCSIRQSYIVYYVHDIVIVHCRIDKRV